MSTTTLITAALCIAYGVYLSRLRRSRDEWRERTIKAESWIAVTEQCELIRFDLKINGEVVKSYFFNGYRLQYVTDETGDGPPFDCSACFGGVLTFDQRIEGM
jgi:hypothetical protein